MKREIFSNGFSDRTEKPRRYQDANTLIVKEIPFRGFEVNRNAVLGAVLCTSGVCDRGHESRKRGERGRRQGNPPSSPHPTPALVAVTKTAEARRLS